MILSDTYSYGSGSSSSELIFDQNNSLKYKRLHIQYQFSDLKLRLAPTCNAYSSGTKGFLVIS